MTLFFDEAHGKLTIREKEKKYVYTGMTLRTYYKLQRLYKKGLKGKIWQIVKNFPEINETIKPSE